MGKVIDAISKIDKNYKNNLEKSLLKAAPKLHEAERVYISNLFNKTPFALMSREECLMEIAKAIKTVKSYCISIHDVHNGKRIRTPIQVFTWSFRDIIRDRFSYLAWSNDSKL